MLSFVKLVVALVAAAGVQSTLLPRLELFGVVPDLFLVLVVFVSLQRGEPESLQAAWGIGLGKDLVSYGRMGFYCLVFLLVGLGIRRVREHVYTEHPVTQMGVVFLSGLVVGAAGLVWEAAAVGPHPWRAVLGLGALALYSAAIAPAVFGFLRWIRW